MSKKNNVRSLQWTGERYLPELSGEIEIEHMHRYAMARIFAQGGVVLDIACGEGYGSNMLAKVSRRVYGVDISEEVILHATEKYNKSNLHFIVGTCSAIPLHDSSVDLIVSFETIEHHDQHQEMLNEFDRVLTPNGLVVISSPDKSEYSDAHNYTNPYHIKELYKNEFQTLLQNFFNYVQIYGQSIIYGSAIVSENTKSNIQTFCKVDDDIIGNNLLPNAKYNIIVASHKKISCPISGLLIDDLCKSDVFLRKIRNKEDEISKLKREIGKIPILQDKINNKEDEISKLKREIGKIPILQDKINNKEDEIRLLNKNINISKKRIRVLIELISFLEDQLSHLETNIVTAEVAYHKIKNCFTWRTAIRITSIIRLIPGVNKLLLICKCFIQVRWFRKQKRIIMESGLFNSEYYRKKYHTDLQPLETTREALENFITEGGIQGRWPSPEFDSQYYIDNYQEVAMSGMNPLVHYMLFGKERHYFISRREEQCQGLKKRSPVWFIPGRISVIVVNLNGRRHLPDLCSSLKAQDYPDFQVIFVDNGSSDGSVTFIKKYYPEFIVIQLKENVGFAEANNIGAEIATGEYYCLLNNDTVVESDWMKKLYEGINAYSSIGAVGSKILFWKRFIAIHIQIHLQDSDLTPSHALLYVDGLVSSSSVYKKWFVENDNDHTRCEEVFHNGRRAFLLHGSVTLFFPVCDGQFAVLLNIGAKEENIYITITSAVDDSFFEEKHIFANEACSIQLDFSEYLSSSELKYILNNAGSVVDDNGNVADRGFGEPDTGQYDQAEFVTSLCGCSMLIKAEALLGDSLFIRDFFAYYEDTELSLRLRKNGYDLMYCPESVVYHKHASTSKENSWFFKYHVTKNRILFLAIHFNKNIWLPQWQDELNHLNHMQVFYNKRLNSLTEDECQFYQKISDIIDIWDELLPLIRQGLWRGNRKHFFPKIGIMNTYWSTLGGAENHAAVIASALQKYGPVDFLSESYIDIPMIEKKFDVDLSLCKPRIIQLQDNSSDNNISSEYDIFINSTYLSKLPSYAKELSYYIVSFPFRIEGIEEDNDENEFLQTYSRFLANSCYTKKWIKRWWAVNSTVVYPSCPLPSNNNFTTRKKEKIILNVGRFFNNGHHCKKQLGMVYCFRELIESGLIDNEWNLYLVGHVQEADKEYLEKVEEAATDLSVEIFVDLSSLDLQLLYEKSAIYWHATGLGEHAEYFPERYEHFGITTIEAMSYGCVPVVINGGGQPEIVDHYVSGFLFNNIQELMKYTSVLTEYFSYDRRRFIEFMDNAIARANDFARHNTMTNIESILAEDDTNYLLSPRIKLPSAIPDTVEKVEIVSHSDG